MSEVVAGRVGPHRESHEPRLKARDFLVEGITPVKGYLEWNGTKGIGERWGMDGNDVWGCCGAAMADHANVAKTGNPATVGTLGRPKFNGTLGTYWAYGLSIGEVGQPPNQPNQPDMGVDNAGWLAFLYKEGLIYGYAEVDDDEFDWFAQLFDGGCVGLTVDPVTASNDFNATPRTPWDAMGAFSGHDTLVVITHADGSGSLVTWGSVQPYTLAYRQQNWTDRWVIYDKDDPNVDHAKLQAALLDVHGVIAPAIGETPPIGFFERVEDYVRHLLGATKSPTPAELQAANMALLPNAAEVAKSNGWEVRVFNGTHFVTAPNSTSFLSPLYAVPNYEEPRNGPTPPPVPVPVPTPPTEYTVTYSAPTETIPPFTHAAGETFVVAGAPPAPAGQTFQSWGDGAHTYAPGSTYTMPAANVTFIAIYSVAPTPTPAPTPIPTPTPTPVPNPPPVPTPSGHPSGFDPPPVEPGFIRQGFDDFTDTTLTALWNPPYNSVSKAAQDGIFLASHCVLRGDSWLRMECYPDPQGALSGWQISQALINAVSGWACAGIQTARRWSPGTTITWAGKWDTYPGVTAINLLMSDGWTSEIDLTEANASVKGGPSDQYEVTFMTNQGGNKSQQSTENTGQDFSQPHLWQAKWTLSGTVLTCDGKLVAQSGFVNNANQFWTIQPQTGDPNTPGPDASITAANPITQYLDWVCFDVPG